MRIWLEDWEWECCGEPFAIGSDVEWIVFPASAGLQEQLAAIYGPEIGTSVTHYESHHLERDIPATTRGRVAEIQAAYLDYESRGQSPVELVPVPGSGRLYTRREADAWAEQEGKVEGTFHGFIVDLTPLTKASTRHGGRDSRRRGSVTEPAPRRRLR